MRAGRPGLLWGVIGALVLLLVLEWVWPSGSTPAQRATAARVARQAHAAAPARTTAAWAQAILARPVFSLSRRPPKPVVTVHGQVVAGQARLAGILITRAGRRAIFAPEGGGRQLVLAEGASVNESTIRQIQADRVLMASGAVLRPTYDRNRVTTTTPPFQPFAPSFPAPGFPAGNPAFPSQGFPNPGFPNPGMINPGFPNAPTPGVFPNANFNPGIPPVTPPGEEAAVPPAPVPMPMRGNLIPQRRE